MNKWMLFVVPALFWSPAQAAEVPATLHWVQRVALSTPVSGVVKAVHVEPGQRVKPGQELLVLDSELYLAKVAESEAAITRLKEEAVEGKRNLERVQELYNRTVISTSELDQAKLRDTRTRALLAEGEARRAQDRKNLEDTVLRAPFDAIVLSRQAEPGQAVAAGLQPQPLVILAKAGEMLARAMLDANQAGRIKPGATASVGVSGKRYTGKVKNLGMEPVAGKDGATYAVDVVFAVQEQLRSGMAAVVTLP
jgi:RND family efflux transporter MFP subunit